MLKFNDVGITVVVDDVVEVNISKMAASPYPENKL